MGDSLVVQTSARIRFRRRPPKALYLVTPERSTYAFSSPVTWDESSLAACGRSDSMRFLVLLLHLPGQARIVNTIL